MLCTSISGWKYWRRKISFPFLAPKSVYSIHQGSALVYETSTDSRSNLQTKNWCSVHCNLPVLCYCRLACTYISLIKDHNTNSIKNSISSFFNTVIQYNYMISKGYLKINYKMFSLHFYSQVNYRT